MTQTLSSTQAHALAQEIKTWARELGFSDCGISDIDLDEHETYLERWLAAGYHGEMAWMAHHGHKRSRPDELVPGTLRIISLRLDYLPPEVETTQLLSQPQKAYISRYALGRDYHKLMRKRIAQLAQQIESVAGPYGYRAFVDSAPVLERAVATKAGLGWIGKNAMLIHPKAGSMFFLGELYTDLPLPADSPYPKDHCGKCNACQTGCPTDAFVDDKVLDARRCISYLTIELKSAIPEALRPLMGNRVFGCDDCQLVCPWTRFTRITQEADFHPRHDLDRRDLLDLFLWDEATFLSRTEGSAIRRIGYERWLRNLAVGLGNAPYDPDIVEALTQRLDYPSELVAEHIQWALQQQSHKQSAGLKRIPTEFIPTVSAPSITTKHR
ncbi:tRNA epoxyqueuosine(34) reductase QueG [Terasakiispira papahanaumokuakeensis]|uniref:Epoxyqueuosine reductase n=1 Tax=Terasakiispira papahanaumokuakeensis TaxID=197479 RepID=A0A1E2V5Y1_9GAMM|nr:tRNA epoxyqueuosine(34) reductase QueG [Terasakiispira papahanaumokuakeensis]ODC02418.1 tRNA epoxyqueuosine(34) reductase QueG [Terasakiispira papahanaumokuakeensis]